MGIVSVTGKADKPSGLRERGIKESGGLTYGYADEERLEEGVITREASQDFSVIRDIDKYGQSILCYRLRRRSSKVSVMPI